MVKKKLNISNAVDAYTNLFVENYDEWVDIVMSIFKQNDSTRGLIRELAKREKESPTITAWLFGLGMLAVPRCFNKKTAEHLIEATGMFIALQMDFDKFYYARMSIMAEEFMAGFHAQKDFHPDIVCDWLLNELFNNPPNDEYLRHELSSAGSAISFKFNWKELADNYKLV